MDSLLSTTGREQFTSLLVGEGDTTKNVIIKMSDTIIRIESSPEGKLEVEIPVKCIITLTLKPVPDEKRKAIPATEILELNLGAWGPTVTLASDDAPIIRSELVHLLERVAAKKREAEKTAQVLLTGGVEAILYANNEAKYVRFDIEDKKLRIKESGLSDNIIIEKPLPDVTGWIFGINFKGSPEPLFVFSDQPSQKDLQAIKLVITAMQQREVQTKLTTVASSATTTATTTSIATTATSSTSTTPAPPATSTGGPGSGGTQSSSEETTMSVVAAPTPKIDDSKQPNDAAEEDEVPGKAVTEENNSGSESGEGSF